MISASVTANEFLFYDNKINFMKLTNLVYLSQGWHLAVFDEPLFPDVIEVWDFGPVIRSLYFEYAIYENNPIKKNHKSLFLREMLDNRHKALIHRVYETHGDLTGIQLSNLSHFDEYPWRECYDSGKMYIPQDLMKSKFKEILRK